MNKNCKVNEAPHSKQTNDKMMLNVTNRKAK